MAGNKAKLSDIINTDISDKVRAQLEEAGVFDTTPQQTSIPPLPSPGRPPRPIRQPRNRRAISLEEVDKVLGEEARKQVLQQLGKLEETTVVNPKDEVVIVTPEKKVKRLKKKPEKVVEEEATKREQTRTIPVRDKQKGLGLFSQVINYKFDDMDRQQEPEESVGDKVIAARTQAEAIKNVSDQLSNTNKLMSMSLSSQDESLKLLKQILSKVGDSGSSRGIFSSALGLLTSVIGGALTLGLGSVSGLFRILTNRNLALFGTMLAAGTLMTGVPSIDSLVSSVESVIPDLDSIMESLGLGERENAPPPTAATPPTTPAVAAASQSAASRPPVSPPTNPTTAPTPSRDATRTAVERTGEAGTPQPIQPTRETPTISTDPMGTALPETILRSGAVREVPYTPPSIAGINRQGLNRRGATSIYSNAPENVTTAYPQRVRNHTPESLSGNYTAPSSTLRQFMVSGNTDDQLTPIPNAEPIRQTDQNTDTVMHEAAVAAATRVETPPPVSEQTSMNNTAPTRSFVERIQSIPRSGVMLSNQSRAAAAAVRPTAPQVSVINNNQQSQQTGGGSMSITTTIDPNEPGPAEPIDSGTRYYQLFGQ